VTLHRRQFLSTLAGAALAPAANTKRPNIILMMADDMGFSDLGCYGSEISTPNLDSLARSGLRFTQFYNTARCCPTRASLMTGLYSHQAGVGHMVGDYGKPGYRGDLNRQCVTIAEVMRSAGYHTAMSGKWHVTPAQTAGQTPDKHNWPLQRGFEKYFGTIHGAGSYYDPVSLTRDNTPIEADRKNFYYTDAIAENAAGFIGEFANKPEPFFLYVAFTSPHWPLHALPEDIAKYKDRYQGGWDQLRAERHRRMVEMGIVKGKWPLTPRDSNVPAWDDATDKEWQASRMAVYAAQIDRMDQNVGRILRKLRETGAEENTLILFLADNGGCAEEFPAAGVKNFNASIPAQTRDGRPVRSGNNPQIRPGAEDTYQSYGMPWANASNTPFRLYKHWVHEGGISTPLIAHWPGKIERPGSITDQPGHLIDIMATCVDAGKSQYPRTFQGNRITPLEGLSLVPVLQGKQRKGHAEIFWEHEGNRAGRQGKWKLVSRYPGTWELYDLEADRTEMHNLAEQQPAKVKELSGKYDAWAARANVVPWGELKRS
jgi:arylsulfatase A-like enzyme